MQRYLRILAANVLIASAYAFLTVPNGIINGGITSLCMSLSRVVPLSVTTLNNIILPILTLLCWRYLGLSYFKGSVFFCLCYLPLFSALSALHWVAPIPVWLTIPLAGVMVGYGVAISIGAGATTVGSDTVAMIVHKQFPFIPIAGAMFGFNMAVMLFGAVTYGIEALIKGILFTGIQTWTVNRALQKSA